MNCWHCNKKLAESFQDIYCSDECAFKDNDDGEFDRSYEQEYYEDEDVLNNELFNKRNHIGD